MAIERVIFTDIYTQFNVQHDLDIFLHFVRDLLIPGEHFSSIVLLYVHRTYMFSQATTAC